MKYKINFIQLSEVLDKSKIIHDFLNIAKSAKFSTDYDDMYNHIFGSNKLQLCVIVDEKKIIRGFATYEHYTKENLVYIQGIIIEKSFQGKGGSKNLIHEIIKKTQCDYVMCRTHNPRIYELFENISSKIHPDLFEWQITSKVKELTSLTKDTINANEKLIVIDAYPDEKIQQKIKNKKIYEYFSQIGKRNAQVIIIEC